MIPWLIDLQDKKVIIVGGGVVAQRKALQFINEEAKVVVIATDFHADFNQQGCQLIKDHYQSIYLKEAFLVYAATDDKKLNQEIVADANRLGILSASATGAPTSLKSMYALETDELIMGISTKGGYPAFSKKLASKIELFDDELNILKRIRGYVLEHNLVDKNQRQEFFNNLMIFDQDELFTIYTSIVKNRGILLIYPMKADMATETFAMKVSGLALYYRDLQFPQRIATLLLLKIKWMIQPMVTSMGKLYQQIKNDVKILIEKPLFINKEILAQLYQTDEKRLFLIHPRSSQDLTKLLECYGVVKAFDQEIENNFETVIPFILTKGYHYQKDILTLSNLITDKLETVLLENYVAVDLLAKEIKRRLEQ